MSLEIRRYPWPYTSAFAFSNDCDFLPTEIMLCLHRFFEASESDGGAGGLEVSDSFFFFDRDISNPPSNSYFKGLGKQLNADATAMNELIRTGYLDTVHTWGNFTSGGFQRRRAEQALEVMQSEGLTVPIWTNHGGGMNFQGIGEKSHYTYQQGDDIANQYYHLDLLDELGVRYYALSRDRTWNFICQPTGELATERERRAPRWALRNPLVYAGEVPSSTHTFDKYEVFSKTETRAGNKIQSFNRYDAFLENGGDFPLKSSLRLENGRRAGPNIGRLGLVLGEERLKALVEKGGVCFMYQHFSTVRFQPDRWVLSRELAINPETVAGLRRLARFHSQGQIWVAAQAILLDYLYMINSIELNLVEQAGGMAKIRVSTKRGYEHRGLAGLTVSVPSNVKRQTSNISCA